MWWSHLAGDIFRDFFVNCCKIGELPILLISSLVFMRVRNI